jgi:shikimate 5-dehydrogenase
MNMAHHKESVMPFLNRLIIKESDQCIGAVNTIKITKGENLRATTPIVITV